jgi:hypothetical protein
MLRVLIGCLLLSLSSCVPDPPRVQLLEDCSADSTIAQLVASNWLAQPAIWRLRQGALLEIGRQRVPMEGFLRLDVTRQEARLLAMNEMGIVLFDLQVTPRSQTLMRAIPQLQEISGLAQGVAQSLRRIFLESRPQVDDHLENYGSYQHLWREIDGAHLGFVFDCLGDLRETRHVAETGDWRVIYNQYQPFGSYRIPGEMIMHDRQHNVTLSLWLREVKQE